MIQGVAAAAISIGGLWLVYVLAQNELPSMGGFLAPLGELQFLNLNSVALLLVIGWLLGAAGSVISLRRFVRSWNASSART
jgi:cell division protein FtsX